MRNKAGPTQHNRYRCKEQQRITNLSDEPCAPNPKP